MTEYSKAKREYIKNLPIYELMDFLNEITDADCRKKLNELLDAFVVDKYRNHKDNKIKYGVETKRNFCNLIKNGKYSDEKKQKTLIKMDEDKHFSNLFNILIGLWIQSHDAIMQNIVTEDKGTDKEILFKESLNNFIEENKKNNIFKESIRTFYQFSPVDIDIKLENEIDKCKSGIEIISKRESKQDKTITQLKAEKEGWKTKYNNLQQEIKKNKELIAKIEEENKEEKERITSLQTKLDIEQQNSQRIKELENQNAELQKEIITKQGSIDELDVLIKDASNEIKDLESTNNNLKAELEDLRQTNNDLSKMDTSSVYSSQILFEDEDLFKLPDEKHSEPLMFKDKDKFSKEVESRIEGKESKYIKSLIKRFAEENFIIVEDEDDIIALNNSQHYCFDPLYIFPEYDWTSYNDWFGYFDNGTFIPSKTKISDYYKFVKTENLPLGVIVFFDFNDILPEIYIESFVKNISFNGGIDLVHQNLIVDKKSEFFKHIELPDSLKFVFVKSKSSKAFEIPCSMKKYEVISV